MAFLSEYPKDKELVTIKKATEMTGVSRRTIYNWIHANKIDYCRIASGSIRIVASTLWRVRNISNQPQSSRFIN